MKHLTLKLSFFLSLYLDYYITCTEVPKSLETYYNVNSEITKAQENSSEILTQHPDGEIKTLEFFTKVLPEIEEFAKSASDINSFDDIAQKIASDYEFPDFFLNSWKALKGELTQVNNFYQTFKRFVDKTSYVDEVTINDFIESHESIQILSHIQSIVLPVNRSKSIFYKFYQALKNKVCTKF